jgi:DNA-directed RNA polymerase subunit N (RpoN/RPB10)
MPGITRTVTVIEMIWYQWDVTVEKSPKEVLDELGIKRYCCRAVFLGTVDEDNIINFSNMEWFLVIINKE